SPSNFANSATSSGDGAVITSSRCSTSRKRSGKTGSVGISARRIWQRSCAASITEGQILSGYAAVSNDAGTLGVFMAEPRIKTTVVGSYPFPDWLGALPSEQAVIDATRVVIHTQEQAGIDLVCDGELYRFDVNHPETNGMIEYFVKPMSGVRSAVRFDELVAYRQ